MGVLRSRHCCFHHHYQGALSFATATALTFLLLASVSALGLNPTTRQLSGGGGAVREERRSGGGGGGGGELKRAGGMEILKRVLSQRLSGPGSSPPSCRSKCGKCTPCKPVHVPIQPGFSMPLEYYPEAWRCKCGNKLFMP